MRAKLNFFIFGMLVSALLSLSIKFKHPEPDAALAAAGDRKVVIQEIRITTGNPVPWVADWQVFVEDKAAQNRYITGGQTSGNFGTPATFNAMTGAQMRAAVKTAVQADVKVPTNDGVN